MICDNDQRPLPPPERCLSVLAAQIGAWMFKRRKACLERRHVGGLRTFVAGLGFV